MTTEQTIYIAVLFALIALTGLYFILRIIFSRHRHKKVTYAVGSVRMEATGFPAKATDELIKKLGEISVTTTDSFEIADVNDPYREPETRVEKIGNREVHYKA